MTRVLTLGRDVVLYWQNTAVESAGINPFYICCTGEWIATPTLRQQCTAYSHSLSWTTMGMAGSHQLKSQQTECRHFLVKVYGAHAFCCWHERLGCHPTIDDSAFILKLLKMSAKVALVILNVGTSSGAQQDLDDEQMFHIFMDLDMPGLDTARATGATNSSEAPPGGSSGRADSTRLGSAAAAEGMHNVQSDYEDDDEEECNERSGGRARGSRSTRSRRRVGRAKDEVSALHL